MVTLKQAQEVSAEIVKKFQPVSITVFGSVARTGSGNDLDIMVVVDDTASDPQEVTNAIQSTLSPWYSYFAIDPFVVGIKNARQYLKTGSPFLAAILDEGILVYMQNAFEEWRKNAKEDFLMAKYLYDGNFYRGACYNAQQAVEKTLKARLLAQGWLLEKIHNIRRLTALCTEYACPLAIPDSDISFLDSIYRSRYPAETGLLPHGEPGHDDAIRAIDCAEKVMRASDN